MNRPVVQLLITLALVGVCGGLLVAMFNGSGVDGISNVADIKKLAQSTGAFYIPFGLILVLCAGLYMWLDREEQELQTPLTPGSEKPKQ